MHSNTTPGFWFALLLGAFVAVLLTGCDGQAEAPVEIPEMRLVTAPAWRHASGEHSDDRFHEDAGQVAVAEPPRAPFTYDLPEGWEERPPTEYRMINLRMSAHPEAECTVAITGGSLEDNLNRWRGQLGLGPIDASAIAALPQVDILGLGGVRVDLEGTYVGVSGEPHAGYRLLGGLLDLGGAGLHVKMVGPATVLADLGAAFDALCGSLRARPRPAALPTTRSAAEPTAVPATQPPGEPTSDDEPRPGGFDPAGLTWQAPATWREGVRDALGMRLATLLPEGANQTSCVITPLPGSAGGFLRNVNLWREQMGAEPLDEAAVETLPTVQVLGSACPLVRVTGSYVDKGGAARGESSLLAVIVPVADHTLFIKLLGPVEEVARERDNFRAFLESIGYQR